MQKPDIIYTDILPRDIEHYINLQDEYSHELEFTIGTEGEERVIIKIWLVS